MGETSLTPAVSLQFCVLILLSLVTGSVALVRYKGLFFKPADLHPCATKTVIINWISTMLLLETKKDSGPPSVLLQQGPFAYSLQVHQRIVPPSFQLAPPPRPLSGPAPLKAPSML